MGVREPAHVLRVRGRLDSGQRAVLVAAPGRGDDGHDVAADSSRGSAATTSVGGPYAAWEPSGPRTAGVGDPDPALVPVATGQDLVDGKPYQRVIGIREPMARAERVIRSR